MGRRDFPKFGEFPLWKRLDRSDDSGVRGADMLRGDLPDIDDVDVKRGDYAVKKRLPQPNCCDDKPCPSLLMCDQCSKACLVRRFQFWAGGALRKPLPLTKCVR